MKQKTMPLRLQTSAILIYDYGLYFFVNGKKAKENKVNFWSQKDSSSSSLSDEILCYVIGKTEHK
ncbi:hypothetical protein DERP_001165 [Dermatophagoides pteronyssinus]|uniref:Uncharacterized protein n=1 Tax=Dermatophagoides pteronyssinus TaxID=6956 RepID=A0ABQ8JDQ7_DERPT|nr:hypothetical protein DERP_001165 [Dermatophagoides pteronyssinus]